MTSVWAKVIDIGQNMSLRADFFNHQGHGDQGWTNLSKLGPHTSTDEPLFMTMKIPASAA